MAFKNHIPVNPPYPAYWQKNAKALTTPAVVEYLHGSYRVSERRACQVARLNRGTFRYHSQKDPRTELRMRIREIAQTRVRLISRKQIQYKSFANVSRAIAGLRVQNAIPGQ